MKAVPFIETYHRGVKMMAAYGIEADLEDPAGVVEVVRGFYAPAKHLSDGEVKKLWTDMFNRYLRETST